jgi:putative phosphoesterase
VRAVRRVAVIADIHGNIAALQAVEEDIARRGAGLVINLGDHASGPLWPGETVDLLMPQSWIQIAGNCDRQIITHAPSEHGASDRFAFERLTATQKEWLAALPATATAFDEIRVFHGTPRDDASYLLETVVDGQVRLATRFELETRLSGVTAPVMVCGHSHVPRIVRIDAGLIVNPGSVGLPAYAHDDPEPHAMETGAPDARYALLEKSNRGWTAELVAVPYDHERAADEARRNGRPDWECALRTGFASR